MTAISATEARGNFSEILGRVAYGRERVTIERRGKPLAVLVPVEELARLEAGAGGGAESAEDPLRRSKVEFDLVADNIPVLISFIDNDGRFRFVNKGYEDWYGVPQDQVAGRHMREIFGEARYRAIEARVAKVLSGERVHYEELVNFKDIWSRYISVEFIPQVTEDGETRGFVALTQDITEHRNAEAAQRAGAIRLRDLFEGSIEGILIHQDQKPVMVNEAWAAIHGYTVDEIFGIDSVVDLVSPADRERLIRYRNARLRGEAAPDRYEYRAVQKDGSEIWLEHLVRVIDWAGTPAIQTVVIDITERKSAEAALQESERRYRSLYESIPLSVWEEDWSDVKKMIDGLAAEGVSDWDTYFEDHPGQVERAFDLCKTLNINPATLEMYGAPGAENALEFILGQAVTEPELRKFASWLASFAKGESTFVSESAEPRADGTAFDARVRSFIPPQHAGTWDRVITTVEDVSDYSRAREALRDLIVGSIEGILIHRDHKPLLVNEAWAAVHGHSVEEVYELDSVVELMAPADKDRVAGYRAARLRGEPVPGRYEYRALHKDGSEIWLENLVRVIDWEGAPAIQTVVIDITERKAAETALQSARDELEQRVEERTRELHATNRALEEEVGTRKEAEARLRESERDLLNLIEGSVQGVLIVTKERKPRFANQACAEIFGYESPDEILALGNTLPLIKPHELERLNAIREAQFSQGEVPIAYEFDGACKDGTTIRLQCMTRTMDWKGERVVQVTLFDITERKRAEEALRDSERRYRLLTEIAPVGIFETDALGDNIFVNDKWCELAGISTEQAYGPGWVAALHPDDRERVSAEWYASAENGKMFRSEYRFQRPDGAVSWLFGQGINMTDAAGKATGFVGTLTDITERREAEETIRTRDTWLRAILENAPLQIVLKDTDGQIMAISRNTGETLGTTMDEFLGRTTADFLPEDVAETYMATDREVVATGRSIQQEVVEDWDGTTRHFLNSKFPLRDDGGQIVGICSLTSDITEAKLAEERLRQAQKMEAVGQLTGGVAHDFNNLLAVVMGNVELLGEQVGAENRQVAAVMRAAGRGAELTQRLLAFSRRQPLKPQTIDLAARVAGMTELLSRTLGATIEISVASSPGLWLASADPGQLENALLNLAINARDAMAGGGQLSISSANASLGAEEIAALLAAQAPEAALEAVGGEPGNPADYVVLAVSDTGSGMSPAVLSHVFEPFFTTKDVGQGSGLGLSMVYGFARQSGGFAAIESAEGQGTTVQLYLPRAEAAASVSRTRSHADQLPRGQGETVLLVEDAQDVRELAAALLDDLGYRVLAAADAAEAGALLAENPDIDLLLTDVILPGGRSGPDFAETARRHNPALKVRFISGYPAETLMQRGGSLALDTPLLSKPFRKAALAKFVRDALDDSEEAGSR